MGQIKITKNKTLGTQQLKKNNYFFDKKVLRKIAFRKTAMETFFTSYE